MSNYISQNTMECNHLISVCQKGLNIYKRTSWPIYRSTSSCGQFTYQALGMHMSIGMLGHDCFISGNSLSTVCYKATNWTIDDFLPIGYKEHNLMKYQSNESDFHRKMFLKMSFEKKLAIFPDPNAISSGWFIIHIATTILHTYLADC